MPRTAHATLARPRQIIQAATLTALAVLAVLAALVCLANAAKAEPAKILALGDSLTAGFGLPQADGFVPVLEAALREEGYDVTVVNGGVSGDTAAGGAARLDWLLADESITHAIVALGGNDMLRGIDPQSTRAQLDSILARLMERGIEPLLVGMYAQRNLGPDYVAAFDGLYPELAAAYDVPLYPFFLEALVPAEGAWAGAVDPHFMQADGLHPTAEGVERIVEAMLPAVKRLLEE